MRGGLVGGVGFGFEGDAEVLPGELQGLGTVFMKEAVSSLALAHELLRDCCLGVQKALYFKYFSLLMIVFLYIYLT